MQKILVLHPHNNDYGNLNGHYQLAISVTNFISQFIFNPT